MKEKTIYVVYQLHPIMGAKIIGAYSNIVVADRIANATPYGFFGPTKLDPQTKEIK